MTPVPDSSLEFMNLSEVSGGIFREISHDHFALETGMRKAEILGLRWRKIRDGQIYLGSDRTKNGKSREIPVSERRGEK